MKRALLLIVTLIISGPAYASGASVEGTLHDKTGALLPGTEMSLQDGQGKIASYTISDKAGHYLFKDILPGSYVLQATQQDAVLGSAHLSILGTENLHKDLDLTDTKALNIVIGPRIEMRNNLSPKTGTSAYKMDAQSIENLPQGADTSLNKVLLQAPGVAEDSAASGSVHIRGEHANLQYRLNGILLPEGISGFGDTIDSHVIENATLLDGALPAQYGFYTSAVVDIDTKSGFQNGGTASIMGGSNGTIQPSISYGGTQGTTDYFVAASHLSSDLGIENPVGSAKAIHDHTEQNKQFGYASYMINEFQHLEMIAGNSISYFQIPNNPNQTQSYQYNGITNFNSANLNERQFESNQYLTGAWQGQKGDLTMQIAPYIRNSETHFRPDILGDLLFNGVASDVQYNDLAVGLQNDNSWRVNAEHTLRGGFTVQNDHVKNQSSSVAFLTDAGGTPLVDGAGNNILSSQILNSHTRDSQLYGTYVQDEWKITDQLTVNYGARFDIMEANISADQLSPRIGFVYKPTDTTTLHAGYARYFTPPPQELVSNGDINGFANTTNAPAVSQNDPVKPERAHVFDAGIVQKVGKHWQFGLDGYYKEAHDMLDEGQFGSALILTPFNYRTGHIYGSEVTVNYTGDKLKAYANFATSRAMGKDIVSSQFNFDDPAELAYIHDHAVHLDHDQTYTASAGFTYDVLENTQVGADGHVGSGLRAGFANTEHLPAYATMDMSITQKLHLIEHDETAIRFSIINLFDNPYELRSGTGIGVGAPQWGARRGFFMAVSQKF